ncbi:MAG: GNAT family N-acetyltransferase, partial [Pseudomonadota bacterium]
GYQNDGIGSALLSRLLLSARNRRIDRIVMYCLLENGRMRAVAQKHRAVLNVADGEIVGEVAPARVSALSLMREAMWDTSAIIEDALETQHRRLANRA